MSLLFEFAAENMPAKYQYDYTREINHLHKEGFTHKEIAAAMLRLGYFKGRTPSFVASFIKRTLKNIESGKITPTVELDEVVELVRKPVVKVEIAEMKERKC